MKDHSQMIPKEKINTINLTQEEKDKLLLNAIYLMDVDQITKLVEIQKMNKREPIRVTKEEELVIGILGKTMRSKDTKHGIQISQINHVTLGVNSYKDFIEGVKKDFYFLNTETMEWEDWSDK